MKINSIRTILSVLLFITFTAVHAEEKPSIEHGREIHEDHCLKCHTDEVYTREDRFVKSLEALTKQVKRCKNAADAPWYAEDTEAVVRFLNNKYYKF